jgi:uncharacterized hydrophobic protein (TIGR00271 family)
MRFIYVSVPLAKRETVAEALEREGVDFVVTEEVDGDRLLFHFPLPTGAVDSVLETLEDAGVEESFVVIGSAETARTPRFRALEERYAVGTAGGSSIAPEEIRSKALGLDPGTYTYYVMTLLSVLVATVGLLLDAPAVVVGAMVIAPQVGSALLASLGLAFSDSRMILRGLGEQVLSLLLATLCAVGFAWLLQTTALMPAAVDVTTIDQISSRTSPGLLSVLVGVCAGAAGAVSLSTDVPVSLVGVAVAAALIPAAAAVGIGVAWGLPAVALGAAVLLAVNLLTVTASGGVALWLLDYRPEAWDPEAPLESLRAGALNATVLAGAVILLATASLGGLVVEQSAFENAVNGAVQAELDDPRYERLYLAEIDAGFGDFGLLPADRRVTVVLGRPAEESYPDLVDRLRRSIEGATGENVSVTVEYVDYES